MKLRILAAGVILAAAGTGFGCGASVASTAQLVYICQQTPCQNGQELEVFDGYGNPGFTVGEYGGVGVLGDNLTITTDVGGQFHHDMVLSFESPAAYNAHFHLPDTCTYPERWLAPLGNWHCTMAGTWKAG